MTADEFRTAVLINPVIDALLDGLARFELPDAWLVSGCLTQTVWNLRSGRPIGYGIDDYDVFYFDTDTSWEAEDRVIRQMDAIASRLAIPIEIRNQARVHLWYADKHRVPYSPLRASTDGIDRFLTCCTQFGLQRTSNGDRIYAPSGFDDLERMIVRPNPTANFSAEAYRAKVARWQLLWPELTVEPPPERHAS